MQSGCELEQLRRFVVNLNRLACCRIDLINDIAIEIAAELIFNTSGFGRCDLGQYHGFGSR